MLNIARWMNTGIYHSVLFSVMYMYMCVWTNMSTEHSSEHSSWIDSCPPYLLIWCLLPYYRQWPCVNMWPEIRQPWCIPYYRIPTRHLQVILIHSNSWVMMMILHFLKKINLFICSSDSYKYSVDFRQKQKLAVGMGLQSKETLYKILDTIDV